MKKVLIRLIATVIILIAAIYAVIYFLGDKDADSAFNVLNSYEDSSVQQDLNDNLLLFLDNSNEDAKDAEIIAQSVLMNQLIGSFEFDYNNYEGLAVKIDDATEYYYAYLPYTEDANKEDTEKLAKLAQEYVEKAKITNSEVKTFWTYFNLQTSSAAAVEEEFAKIRQVYYKQVRAQLELAIALSEYIHNYVFINEEGGFFSEEDEMYKDSFNIYGEETLTYMDACIEAKTDIDASEDIYTSTSETETNLKLTAFIAGINGY